MQSEKVMYWMTLGVLVLATTTGFISENRECGNRMVERSIAMASRASEAAANYAANYAALAGLAVGRQENDLAFSPRAVAEVQTRVACVQRTLARRQVELARVQAMKAQVRMLKRSPRAIVWPAQNLVIEVQQDF
jgi:hypothetical protein